MLPAQGSDRLQLPFVHTETYDVKPSPLTPLTKNPLRQVTLTEFPLSAWQEVQWEFNIDKFAHGATSQLKKIL